MDRWMEGRYIEYEYRLRNLTESELDGFLKHSVVWFPHLVE